MKNQLTRKKFLKLSTAAALAIPAIGLTGCLPKKESESAGEASIIATNHTKYIDELGIQLFMIREILEKDPQRVLQSIADIGIKNIEFFDPSTIGNLAPIARDLGMNPLCTHFLPGYISGKWEMARQFGMMPPQGYGFDNIVEDCLKNDVKYMGIAIMMPEERETLDDYKRFAESTNRFAEKSKSAGVQLYYHNHSFEFEPMDGTTPIEEMVRIFDPDLVKLELDVFWITISGNDPVEWIKKYSDRVIFIHLKDLVKGTPVDYTVFEVAPEVFTEMGSGVVDIKGVLAAARKAGAQYAFLDQDNTQMDKIESIAKSYRFLKNLDM